LGDARLNGFKFGICCLLCLVLSLERLNVLLVFLIPLGGHQIGSHLGVPCRIILDVLHRQRVGLTKDDCPGKEKRDFDIKYHEEKSHNIIAQVELNPRAADCWFTTLVDRQLVGIRLDRTHQSAENEVKEQEKHADAKKDQQIKDQLGHAIVSEAQGLPSLR